MKNQWIALVKTHRAQFIQYVATGGTAFAIDFFLLYLLTDILHFHYLQSAAVSYLAGFFWCFEINRRWTFRGQSQRLHALRRFTAVAAMNYALTLGLLYVFVHFLQMNYLIAKVGVVGLTVLWTFFLYRGFVFHTRNREC